MNLKRESEPEIPHALLRSFLFSANRKLISVHFRLRYLEESNEKIADWPLAGLCSSSDRVYYELMRNKTDVDSYWLHECIMHM